MLVPGSEGCPLVGGLSSGKSSDLSPKDCHSALGAILFHCRTIMSFPRTLIPFWEMLFQSQTSESDSRSYHSILGSVILGPEKFIWQWPLFHFEAFTLVLRIGTLIKVPTQHHICEENKYSTLH